VIMVNVIMVSVFKVNVVMGNVFMVNVIKVNVFMVNVIMDNEWYLILKTNTEQPPIFNSHFFRVPRVVVVNRFDCNSYFSFF